MAIPFLVPAIMAGISAISQGIAQRRQNKKNLELAKFQNDANQAAIDRQNAYNTPAAQMARYKDAGLNPNLIYSQGSSGNQSSISQYPEIGRPDYQSVAANLVPQFNQSALAQSQVAATNAKTVQTYAVTEVNRMQARLIAANPLLDDEGFRATIDGLKATAQLKMSQDAGQIIQNQVAGASAGHQVSKIFHEVQLLEQKFNLGTQDKAIKAEILKSQQFRNAILEVQKKFMTDGDITPQHILQFILLLLNKSL